MRNNSQPYRVTTLSSRSSIAATEYPITDNRISTSAPSSGQIITALKSITFIIPSKHSPEAFPADHWVWREFDELMMKLDSMEDVDDDLYDGWVGDLRKGSNSRLESYDD